MAICNIIVYNDADFYREFQYTAEGTPVDLTGAVMWMALRRHAEDVAAEMRLGTDTGEIILSDPVNGKWTIFIAQERLERLALGDYDHSLVMERATIKTGIWSGLFTNNAGPSRGLEP